MSGRFIVAALLQITLSTAVANAGETTRIPATPQSPEVAAYVARPAGSALAPGVLVLHGCEGYGPRYAAIADMLANHGFVAVAIAAPPPAGARNACSDREGSRDEASDARAALAWMQTQSFVDGKRLALLGFSMGAIAALDIVDTRRPGVLPDGLKAAVAYYPACRDRDAASVSVPLQILDGDADDWTPAPACQTLAHDATAAGKTVSITTYPGATHAFNIDAPDRVTLGHHLHYDATATAAAQVQTLDFLHAQLGSTP